MGFLLHHYKSDNTLLRDYKCKELIPLLEIYCKSNEGQPRKRLKTENQTTPTSPNSELDRE